MNNNEQKPEKVEIIEKPTFWQRTGGFVNQGVINIFVNYTPERYQALYHQRHHWLWIDLGIIAVVVILFVQLLFWWNHPLTSNQYLDLELLPDRELISGQDYNLTLTFHNNNKNTLTNCYVNFNPPAGYHLLAAQQDGKVLVMENNIIKIGDLLAGASGEIVLIGWQWAPLNEKTPWSVTWYDGQGDWPRNKTIKIDVQFVDTSLEVQVESNKQVYSGNVLPILIKLTNKSNYDIEQIKLQFYPTTDWQFLEPTISEKNNYQLVINKIPAHSTKEINIKTRLLTEKNDIIHLGMATAIGNKYNYWQQNWQDIAVQTRSLQVVLDLQLNKEDNYYVGKKYLGRLYYYNREKKDLLQVKINLIASSKGLDVSFLKPTFEIPLIKAQEENYLPFEFIIKKSDHNNNQAFITSELIWLENKQTNYLRSKSYALTVMPSIEATARLYYHTLNGEQIGIGPLPPRVNKTTRYWLSIEINPTIGYLEKMKTNIILSANVKVIDFNTSVGRVENNNQVTWVVDSYNQNGDNLARLNLYLEIKPTISDLGKTVILMEKAFVNAISNINKLELKTTIDNIDSNLANDQTQPNDGKVVN